MKDFKTLNVNPGPRILIISKPVLSFYKIDVYSRVRGGCWGRWFKDGNKRLQSNRSKNYVLQNLPSLIEYDVPIPPSYYW